jgi:trans-aconitate methyltransferase
MSRRADWTAVYGRTPVTEVSWYQPEPTPSLELIAAAGLDPTDPVIDVGGGASTLVDHLLDDGHRDVTVLDVAGEALATARDRLGDRAKDVHWIETDLLDWQPTRRYRLCHDRAVFHFLTDPADRDRYLSLLSTALAPGGYLIVATFAADGPTTCSGLPTARYSPHELAAQFPGLNVVRETGEEHHTPTGRIQPFTWLLLTDHSNRPNRETGSPVWETR